MGTSPAQMYDRARRFLGRDLWTADRGSRGWGALLAGLQLTALIVRGFIDDKLLLRASALTYMTSLAIVPILVVALSVIDFLGLSKNLVVMVVNQFLAGSPQAVDRLMGLVETANVGAFGSASGAIFLGTTLLSLRHAEETFNEIWGAAQSRSWVRRFTNYLAVMVLAPLLLGVLVSLSPSLGIDAIEAGVEAVPVSDVIKGMLLGVGPLLFLFLTFGFAYYVLPNTEVRLKSAAIGALVASLLFSVAQYGYVSFSVGVARYDSLFGGFAIVPLLLVWIYVSWSIVLLGAEIAHAHQNLARYRREARDAEMEPAEREAVGLRLILELARCFRDAWPPQSAERLAERLESSLRVVSELLSRFEGARLITPCGEGDGSRRYQLGRAAEQIAMGDVFAAMRGRRLENPEGRAEDPAVKHAVRGADAILTDVDAALGPIRARSLSEMVAGLPRQEAPE